MGGVGAALAEHAFEHLFIECLGWDRFHGSTTISHGDINLNLTGVAQKRGFAVFTCPAHRTVLANRRLLRDIQRQLRRTHHEHILIYFCETPRKQVWQWATTMADGRRILHREHPFFSSDPPKRLVERIEQLTISFQDFWSCYKLEFVETELIATHGAQGAREHFEQEMEEAGVTAQQWRHFCVARHLARFSELDKFERSKLDRPDRSAPLLEVNGDLRAHIQKALASLRPRHAKILKLRYGFEQPPLSLQAVGDLFGLTRERIRQLQCVAERKLMQNLLASNLHGEFDAWQSKINVSEAE